MNPDLGDSRGSPARHTDQFSSLNSGRESTAALCAFVQCQCTLSVFPRATCRGRNWHSGELDLLSLGAARGADPFPCCLKSLSCLPVILSEHAELATSLTCHQSTPAVQIRQNLWPMNSSILQSLVSFHILAFSISSNYAKWGVHDRKRILKITGASFAHLYVNPYSQKSMERGLRGFLLLWTKLALSSISGSSSTLSHILVLPLEPAKHQSDIKAL